MSSEKIKTLNSSHYTEPPTAPASLRAEDIDKTSLTLVWTPPEAKEGVTGYVIEKCLPDSDQWVEIAHLSGRAKSHMVADLPEGKSFYFRIIAENPAGQSSPTELHVPVKLTAKKGEIGPCVFGFYWHELQGLHQMM